MHSFQPKFCKERHFPREITKAFPAPSLTVTKLLSHTKCSAGHVKDQILLSFVSCSIIPPMMTLWQEGRALWLNYCNSVSAELSAGVSTPHHLCAVRMSEDWHSSGSPASSLLGRNPALLEKFWQLFHGWHRALSTPLHFLHYLGTVLKLQHILPYFIVSSGNSLNPGLWLASISFLLSHHCVTKILCSWIGTEIHGDHLEWP